MVQTRLGKLTSLVFMGMGCGSSSGAPVDSLHSGASGDHPGTGGADVGGMAGLQGQAGASGTQGVGGAGASAGSSGNAGVSAGGTTSASAGTAGFSGSAGSTGGVGGVGGVGGQGASSACSSMSPICPELCGDGVRGTCTVPCGPGGPLGGGNDTPPPPPGGAGGMEQCPQTETCDGLDLGTTCAELGFLGGTPQCSRSCTLDSTSCSRCSVPGGGIVACDESILSATAVTDLSFAVKGGSVGVAWISSADTPTRIHLAILDASLTMVAQSQIQGIADPRSVSLTSFTSGFLLAIGTTSTQAHLYQVDTSAQSVSIATLDAAANPRVTDRSSGPLVTWLDDGGIVNASVLGAAGLGASHTIFDAIETELGSQIAVSDGFLVAQRDSLGVAVAHLDVTGALMAKNNPVGDETEYPQLALSGNQVHMTYAAFGGAPVVRHLLLGTTGLPLSAPSDFPSGNYAEVPVVPYGAGALALLPGFTGQVGTGNQVSITVLGSDGSSASTPTLVARAPSLQRFRMAALGDEVIVGWFEAYTCPGSIGFARVKP